MTESEAVGFEYKGKPAKMSVMRNDGYCWGRIRQGDVQLDVETDDDLYDETDAGALDVLIQAAGNPNNVSSAEGWL